MEIEEQPKGLPQDADEPWRKDSRVSSTRSKVSSGQQSQTEYKYPISVFFIIANEFCERFCYYGMRTVLSLYLAEQLLYSEDTATVIYHIFVMICYFTPVIGGAIADSYWGKFRTILYLSLVYAVGTIVLSFSSVMDINTPHRALAIIGLVLIGCGTGGIKPCVSSFGGDQFKVPEQEVQLQKFFSVFYFSINAGSLISTFLTPILRQDVSCFGSTTCYPLAFAVPTALMILCVVIFVSGYPMYKIKKPEGNIIGKVLGCVGHAVVRKVRIQKKDKREHWLDYADDTYSRKLINDTKILVNIVILFLPTIVFWALYEQQGSRWTFQANQMDGNVYGWIVQPDQMQSVNAILCLVFIPLFEKGLYPLLQMCRICRTPLQKICSGGILAGFAFIISGIVQLRIRATYAIVPSAGESQLRIYNTIDCPISIASSNLSLNVNLTALSTAEYYDLKPTGIDGSVNVTFTTDSSCTYPNLSFTSQIQLLDEEISSYIVFRNNSNKISTSLITLRGTSDVTKTLDAYGKMRVIYGGTDNVVVKVGSNDFLVVDHKSEIVELEDNKWFDVYVNGRKLTERIFIKPGGVYTMLLSRNLAQPEYTIFIITTPNDVNIMWQLPQYFVMTAAEIMLSITGLEFSYSQAPVSLKSVISSFWLLTDSFGNMIVLIIAGLEIFDNEAYEMFLYSGLMFAVMGIFILLAINYKYVVNLDDDDEADTTYNSINEETSRI